jgi:prophage regulatory protein
MKSHRVNLLNSAAAFLPSKVPPERPHKHLLHHCRHGATARPNKSAEKKSAAKRRSHRVSGHDDAEGGDDDAGDDDGAGSQGNFKHPINLLDYDDLRARGIRVSRVQLWRLIRTGKFPRQIKVGTKNAWVEREIEAWIESRIAARDDTAD